MASQITSITIVYSAVYSGGDEGKHQSSASLAFVRVLHCWPVNSPHKGPVTWNMFPFDDVNIIPWHGNQGQGGFVRNLGSGFPWQIDRGLEYHDCHSALCRCPLSSKWGCSSDNSRIRQPVNTVNRTYDLSGITHVTPFRKYGKRSTGPSTYGPWVCTHSKLFSCKSVLMVCS